MKTNILAAVLAALLLLSVPDVVQAQFNFTTNNGTITITGYTGPGGAVTIPSAINDLPVTCIGNMAFFYCTSLINITIPNSVTYIGSYAFAACTSLTHLTIPPGVISIGEAAFDNCTGLTSVTIPDSVVSIGSGAFYYCTNLIGVAIGKSVASLGNYAFYGCSSLVGVYFRGSAPSLGAFAFEGDSNATVYYLLGTTGWDSTFGDRPTVLNNLSLDAFHPEADNAVECAVVQADRKIVVGGVFSMLGGLPRSRIGRLNPDGTLDPTFNPGVSATWVPPGNSVAVYALAVQPDGKIVVGGYFTTLAGQPCSHIGRLNSDGTLDTNFNAAALGGGGFYPGNLNIDSIALQEDGKIVVAGEFNSLGGQPRQCLGRLNSDGRLDTSFVPRTGIWTHCIALQPDGKILVGGQMDNHVGRLNPDGTLDTNFSAMANGNVYALAMQADGKILIGGQFTSLDGQERTCLGRLNADGTLDNGFRPSSDGNVYGGVYAMALQTNGKLLVGGAFTSLCGLSRSYIGRLNADGSLDLSFDFDADNTPNCLVLQEDGKILVGGGFTKAGGQSMTNFCRLINTEPATQELICDDSSITWSRGGTGPEVWRVRFDVFSNGAGWTGFDVGTRVSGGWKLEGISVPPNSTIRARGFITAEAWDASSWFVETAIGPPAIANQPANYTNNAGTTITFDAPAWGSSPLQYQWCKDGVNLEASGNVSGVHTSSLTVSNLLKPDGGRYAVIVSNGSGTVTGLVGTLNVVDPWISSQPVSVVVDMGRNVTFNASAQGTPPLSYQWRKNGVWLPEKTQASLSLTGVQAADIAAYDLVVSNSVGTATSVRAFLTVNQAMCDSFNPGANAMVCVLAVQLDGKVIVGGDFTTLCGQARNRIARLNADGSLDIGFNPGANNEVVCLAVQVDGKILIGGSFTSLGGRTCNYFGRLNADGSLDINFKPQLNGPVNALVVLPDGRILVGGSFTSVGGRAGSCVARLNTDGTLDLAFNAVVDGIVYSLVAQLDGQVVAGGNFTTVDGQPRANIARIHADGTLDSAFVPGANNAIYTLAVEADGSILAGGTFTALGGLECRYIGRLRADGSLDTSFNAGADGSVYTLAGQANGKLLLGGEFGALGGQPRGHLGRLNGDGSLDLSFGLSVNSVVSSIAVGVDGKILLGGAFPTLDGQARQNIARLTNNELATDRLSFDGSTITWLRDGSSPELCRASFEATINGIEWTGLGAGIPSAGGWQLTGIALSANSALRARGFITGGQGNGSGWFVESTRPAIQTDGFQLGHFETKIIGSPNQVVVVECSPNLLDWLALATNTLGIGPLYFSDPQWTNCPARFYRVRSP
jgi:uncharacterized delta-60 repeat protein